MNPERKINIFEEDNQKEIKDYIDKKIEAEFSVIDRKLKNSFQAIKQDLYSLKYASGLGIGGRNREIQDVFDEKLVNLKKELEEKVEQLKNIEIQVSKKENKSSKKKKALKKSNLATKKKISKKRKVSKPAKELSKVYEMMQKQLENKMSDLKTREALLSKQEKQLDKFK